MDIRERGLRGARLRMDLSFETMHAEAYKGPTQKIRILTEHWVGRSIYCPNCGRTDIRQYPPNLPVADFFCPDCNEQYELKSQKRAFGSKIGDGAYRTMIDRLNCSTNPNLLLLHYDPLRLSVLNLLIIPKYFLIPDVIERRKPLTDTARRAGWTGCNILLRAIPEAGRISLIKDQMIAPREDVLAIWRQTRFLNEKSLRSKGWLLCVMRCIEKLNARIFTLGQCYGFEDEIRAIYPGNQHIKAKIRQQLQVLRDQGYLEFLGGGTYRRVDPASPTKA